MSEHTKEPWTYCGQDRGGCRCGGIWSKAADYPVAVATMQDIELGRYMSTEERAANARRIVACVNYCQGLHNEWLEKGPGFMSNLITGLEKQRDELLASSKALRDYLHRTPIHGFDVPDEIWVPFDETITKAEASQ